MFVSASSVARSRMAQTSCLQRLVRCMSTSMERKPEMPRFYKQATCNQESDGNFQVMLDSRKLKTPKKNPLALPTKILGDSIAAEWNSQDGIIRPHAMHLTGMANSALDKEYLKEREVKLDLLVEYLHTDTVCFRSSFPSDLTALQIVTWDPYITYFNQRFGTNMVSTLGLEPPAQNAGENLVKFRSYLESLNPFEITAMENAIAMCHSAIVAVAVMDRHVSVEKGIKDAYLEAEYQRDVYGRCEDEDVLQMHEKAATLASAVLLSRFSKY